MRNWYLYAGVVLGPLAVFWTTQVRDGGTASVIAAAAFWLAVACCGVAAFVDASRRRRQE